MKKKFLFFIFLIYFKNTFGLPYLTKKDIEKLPAEAPTHVFYYGKDPHQFAELRLPLKKNPSIVVLIHGGCWLAKIGNLKLTAPLAHALTQEGIATWNIEYRCLDQSGGGWPGTFEDVSHALNYLKKIAPKYNLNLNKIVIVGHSTGGQLALWLAAQPKLPTHSILYSHDNLPIRGVINLAGPGSLKSFYPLQGCVCGEKVITHLLGGSPTEVPEKYHQTSPIELLPLGIKQILITGDDDASVPPILAEEYQAAAQEKGDDVQFILIKHASHFELISPKTTAWPQVNKAVFDLLEH